MKITTGKVTLGIYTAAIFLFFAAPAARTQTPADEALYQEYRSLKELKSSAPAAYRAAIEAKKAKVRSRLNELKQADGRAFQAFRTQHGTRRRQRMETFRSRHPQEFQEFIKRRAERFEKLRESRPEQYQKLLRDHPGLDQRMARLQESRTGKSPSGRGSPTEPRFLVWARPEERTRGRGTRGPAIQEKRRPLPQEESMGPLPRREALEERPRDRAHQTAGPAEADNPPRPGPVPPLKEADPRTRPPGERQDFRERRDEAQGRNPPQSSKEIRNPETQSEQGHRRSEPAPRPGDRR